MPEDAEHSGVHEYPNIHSIHTHLIKFGELDEQKKLILIVPGNPGAIEFYEEFMGVIHKNTGIPVWGLSHAGHSEVPAHAGWSKPDEAVFSLEGQIQHKVYFISEYLPADVQVMLIGHSIGAYILLETMDRIEKERIIHGFLLFPTIERMAVSPQGKRMTPVLRYFRWFLVLIAFFLYLLPRRLRQKLIDWTFDRRKSRHRSTVPRCIRTASQNVINPYCVANATYMANIEMSEVSQLDKDRVRRHLDKITLYYGSDDHWCPVDYYHEMKLMFPEHERLHLCDSGFRHAFIIDASREMGDKVSQWINAMFSGIM